MADAAEKEKAEKLAAAKKRFEQLKKQKDKGKKSGDRVTEKKKEEDKLTSDSALPPATQDNETTSCTEPLARSTGSVLKDDMEDVEDKDFIFDSETPSKPPHGRQASLSLQSKMRSTSFRRISITSTPLSPTTNGSRPPNLSTLSPDGDAVTEIYRKQAFRLEEMERENRKLSKEAEVAESRWRKTEDELEELRENSGQVAELKSRAEMADAKTEEVKRLKVELTALQRHNSHLQSLTSRPPRHAISPSEATNDPSSHLAQLNSKSEIIESMEMDISNLRIHLSKSDTTVVSLNKQVLALEEKLERAERTAGAAQRELLDARRNLDRASEKAVREGSERTSAETRIRGLTREMEASANSAKGGMKRVEVLEKKLAALTTLHKESDTRRQNGERERERAETEVGEFRKRVTGVENENLRLKEERERLKKKSVAGGGDDEGLDELEDEERKRLEGRVRELEAEASDLRSVVWREKKKGLQGGEENGTGSPGGFDEVDLGGPFGPMRRQSLKPGRGHRFAGALSSGFNAWTGGGERSSLDLGDDDMGFDEDAFRQAQEEEGRKRLERIKEVKRGLKDWEGWRMDIVDSRTGGGGAGEIFDL